MAIIIFAPPYLVAADIGPLPHAQEFTAKLGLTIKEAASEMGILENIFVHRGELEEEDNVVFFYPGYFYLFWFRDRVWQLRADKRWDGDVDGVRMGMSRAKVETLWGLPINASDDAPTWVLPDMGYPARVRLFFQDDALVDLYVYRSDW